MRAELHRIAAAALMACGLAATGTSLAQTSGSNAGPPAGSPTDVRYTPVAAGEAGLYPRQALDETNSPRVIVEVDRDGIPADGQTPVKVRVRLLAADGQPLTGRTAVTIEHSGGRLLLPGARTDEFGPRSLDADRAVPGVQWMVDGGSGEFTLLAPAEAQDVRLRITADGATAAGTISFVPEQRAMVAVGLVEGVISLRSKVAVQPVRRGDAFEQEIESWSRDFNGGKANLAARTALFLKGTVRGDLLLTAAYDSDKATRARLLRDIRPDELYPVYGDASLRSFDARSGSRLYLRVDRDKSYVLYGDFVTGDGFSQALGQGNVASLKQRSLGNYNRTATGVRAHHEAGGLSVSAFVINDSLRQVVEEFASQGSGPYGLRNSAALEGSEKVEVVVRDRTQPSRIVSVRPLQRLVDYSFEPFSGRVLLSSFLPAFDADLNPVSLRITYEVDQGGPAFWVGGADAQWRLNTAVEIGGGVVSDRNALSPYELLSANATLRLGANTVVVAEVARSSSTVNTNPTNQTVTPGLAGRSGELDGLAARVELAHQGERTEARIFAGRSSPLFNNPSAPLNGGRGELYARGAFDLTESLKVYAEATRSEDRAEGGGEQQAAGLGLRWRAIERLTLDASLRGSQETIGARTTGVITSPFGLTSGLTGSIGSGAGGGLLGFGNQTLDPVSGLPVIQQGGLQQGASSLAEGTELSSRSLRLGAGYRVDERLTLGAELETDVSGDERRRLALGADYAVWDRTRLYGRWERQQGWVNLAGVSDIDRSASRFALGVESGYWRDTQLFSEYRLRDAVSGRDLQLASGLRHGWDIAEGWRATVAAENVRVVSGDVAPSRALAGGLDWAANPLWRASTGLEWRRSDDVDATTDDERFDTLLWRAMVARKLDRDWTLLGRHYLLRTDYRARGDVQQQRSVLGLAYRDTDRNRVNALAKLEHRLERDASNAAAGELRSRAWIASAHADWHPSRPWWVTGRVAGKWQQDRFEAGVEDSFRAQLVSGRVVWDISERWDVGVLAAGQFGQRGARQHALGAEVGYLLQTNLWLSAGVNATGFDGDADLAGYEYTQRGVYLRLRFKFDEDLFRGQNPEVNRSLDR
jgi:hypothetical protein